ncbi:MAG: VaFE repeat-containing surface-anchored protein [Bilifractor sp.]
MWDSKQFNLWIAQGDGSLAGAQYTIKYYDVQNADENSLKNEKPLRTWVLQTNNNGFIALSPSYKAPNVQSDEFYVTDGQVGMPIGTILIQETKAPDGYQLNNQIYVVHFNPDANGDVKGSVDSIYAVDDATDQVKAKEQATRGGLNFQKRDANNSPMSGVPFVITSETTGESHVIIADADGKVNTEANKHSNNTNGNDSLVRKTAEGGYICDDPSKLDASAGIWFGDAAPDDTKMALLFDKYTISEVFVKGINYGKNISNKRKNDTAENIAGSVLGVVIDTNGKNVSLDTEVWENPDVLLETTAKNADVESKNIALTNTATVVDTVKYENLTPGDTYTLKGKLVDKSNTDVSVADAEVTFTPAAKNGTVDVTFHFSSANLEGKTLVAFEYLNWKGIEIAKHENAGDTEQTVYVPKISTTLTNQATGKKSVPVSKTSTFKDTVKYENLAPGEKYIIKGQLIQKSTGTVLATADSGEFTVDSASMNGTKDVIFSLDTTSLANETIVAYERLYVVPTGGTPYEITKHEDINDADQSMTLTKPSVGTTAIDGRTRSHIGTSDRNATIIDTVKLNSLTPGLNYTVRGTLMDQKTGKPLLENTQKVTAEGTISFDKSGEIHTGGMLSNARIVKDHGSGTIDMTVDMTFTLDSTDLSGRTITVFEDLIYDNDTIATHSDLTDENQSIHYPKIRTIAYDGNSTDHVGTVGSNTQLADVVHYSGVIPGSEKYKIRASLMYRNSGTSGSWKPFLHNNQPVILEKEFTADSDNGSETITCNVNTQTLSDKDTIFWDELYVQTPEGAWEIAALHTPGKDGAADDENELLHFPVIRTTLYQNDVTGSRVSANAASGGNSLTYQNPGTTGINNRSTQMSGKEGSRKQYKGSGATYTDGSTGQLADKDMYVTYVDRVSYSNLIPGHTYIMESTLWAKETLRDADISSENEENPSRPVRGEYMNGYTSADGTYHEGSITKGIVTGRTIFTPTEANMANGMASGSVDVKIIFNSSYAPGTLIVAFEDLKVRTLNDKGKAVYTGFITADKDASQDATGDVRKDGWGNIDIDDSTEYIEAENGTVYRNAIDDTGARKPDGEVVVATHSDINDRDQSIMTRFFTHLNAGGRGTAIFYIVSVVLTGFAGILLFRRRKKGN